MTEYKFEEEIWKVDPEIANKIRKHLSKRRAGWPCVEDTQFTVWGKFGKRPVRITYDRGKLKGNPEVIKEIQFIVNQIKTGQNWTYPVDDLL